MKKKIFSILFALVLVLGFSVVPALANSQATLTIGDISALPGDTVTVPIMANDVASFMQGAIDLRYDPGVVIVTEVTRGNGPPIIDSEISPGHLNTIQFAFGDWAGDVVIANVTFQAVGSPGASCPLHFSVEGGWTTGGSTFWATHLAPMDGTPIPLALIDGTFTIMAAVLPMSEFEIDKASIDFRNPGDDKVSVKGTLALANGNGVDIDEDDVTVTVGPLSEIIYAGTMVDKDGKWECKGFGAIKKMKIDWNKGKFEFSMDNVNLSGLADPAAVYISLQVGDDLGEKTIPMTEKKRWDYKAP